MFLKRHKWKCGIITVLAGVGWLLLVDAKLSRHQLWSEMMIRSEPNQFQLQKIVCFQLWRRSRAIYRHYLNEICAAGTILLECSVQRSVSVTIKILNDVAPESAHCCSLSAGCQSGAGAALIAAEMLCYYQLCTMRLIVWSGGDNIEIKAHKLLLYGTNFYVLDGIEIFSMLCNVFEMCLNPMTLLKHLYSPFVIPLCNVSSRCRRLPRARVPI